MSTKQPSHYRDLLESIEVLYEMNRRGLLKGILAAAGSVATPKPLIAAIKAFPLNDIELLDKLFDISSKMPQINATPGTLNTSGIWYLRNNAGYDGRELSYRDIWKYFPDSDRDRLRNVVKDQVLKTNKYPDWHDLEKAAENFYAQTGNKTVEEWMNLYHELTGNNLEMQNYFNIIRQSGREPFSWLRQNNDKLNNLVDKIGNINLKAYSKHLSDLKAQGKELPRNDSRDDFEWDDAEYERERAKLEKSRQQGDELKTSGTATGKLVKPWNVAAKSVNFNKK